MTIGVVHDYENVFVLVRIEPWARMGHVFASMLQLVVVGFDCVLLVGRKQQQPLTAVRNFWAIEDLVVIPPSWQ